MHPLENIYVNNLIANIPPPLPI